MEIYGPNENYDFMVGGELGEVELDDGVSGDWGFRYFRDCINPIRLCILFGERRKFNTRPGL